MKDAAKGIGEFFDYIWGDTEGWVYLPVIRHVGEGKQDAILDQYMLQWPAKRSGAIKHVLRHNAEGADAYFSPALFSKPKPTKDNVLGSHVLWADFDSTTVDWNKVDNAPEPTLTVESSPGREHSYWKLDEFVTDVSQLDERNRSIAYAFKADTSGWDANQFLRPPFTTNTGAGKEGRAPAEVRVKKARKGRVALTRFSALPSAKDVVEKNVRLDSAPDIEDVIALGNWHDDMWSLFKDPNKPEDRSGAMMRLAYYGAEQSFSDEQIYTILRHADDRWGKYKQRLDRDRHLLDMINRARQKIGYDFADNSMLAGLIPSLGSNVEENPQAVYGFQEFLDADFHVEWLMENLLAVGGFGIITGAPGVGKTQIGIQLGISLALGEDFIGWKNAGSKKKVLFLSLEMPGAPMGHFISNIAKHYTSAQHMTLEKNFKIAPFGEAIPFDILDGQKFIDSLMQEHMPDVLFIDSFKQVLSQDLKEEQPVRAFTKYLAKAIRHKYNCAVYMIHHNRKEQGGMRAEPSLDDLYGNRFLTSDLDFAFTLRQLRPDTVTVNEVKNRLAMMRNSFDLHRDEHLHFTLTDSMTDGGFEIAGVTTRIEPINRDAGPDGAPSPFAL